MKGILIVLKRRDESTFSCFSFDSLLDVIFNLTLFSPIMKTTNRFCFEDRLLKPQWQRRNSCFDICLGVQPMSHTLARPNWHIEAPASKTFSIVDPNRNIFMKRGLITPSKHLAWQLIFCSCYAVMQSI